VGAFLAGSEPAPRRFAVDELSFPTGSAQVPAAAGTALDELAATLEANPDAKIRVEGFADSSGDPQANLALSQRRADAVRRELVGKGVPADRIEAVGMGSEAPGATAGGAAGEGQDRRADIVVTER
jgi:outer membrane protein OmpA-like peptidoglycan-associated protein